MDIAMTLSTQWHKRIISPACTPGCCVVRFHAALALMQADTCPERTNAPLAN